jgi:GntR family transcriptional repressor for pyruvate dehydrogenase complex
MVARLSDKYALTSPPRLPDQVAAIIASQIEEDLYKPGDKLPSESQLGEVFGVSRSVVREALAQLKYEGLLESRQGKGIQVVGTSGRRFFHVDEAEQLTREELTHFYEIRAIIEGEAAALAARRRKAAHVKKMRGCIARMATAVKSRTDGTKPDLEFHQTIAEASGNTYIKDLMGYLTSKACMVIRTARENSSREAKLPALVQREHEAIFEAISAGDADAAMACSRRHLLHAARRLGLD